MNVDTIKFKNSWCTKCNINVGEEITRNIFEILFETKFPKRKPKWLQQLELDGYNKVLQLGFEYDGEQHFKLIKRFHKTQDDFEQQKERDLLKDKLCIENNVTLIRIPYTLKYGQIKDFIIDKCKQLKIEVPNNVEIDHTTFSSIYSSQDEKYKKMKEFVEKKNGRLVNTSYVSSSDKISVICSNNHTFETCWNYLNAGTWCSICSEKKKHTIEKMKTIAKERGGECLSTEYINIKTDLEWKCKNGHKWVSRAHNIIAGHWCMICHRKSNY